MHLIPVPSGLSAYFLLIPLRGQEECRKQAGIGDWGRSTKKMSSRTPDKCATMLR